MDWFHQLLDYQGERKHIIQLYACCSWESYLKQQTYGNTEGKDMKKRPSIVWPTVCPKPFALCYWSPIFFSGTRQESIGPGGASVPQPQFISLWCQSTSRKRWITIRSKPIVEPLFSPSVIREKMLMCPSSGNWNVKGNLGSAFFLSPSAWGMEHKASSAAAFLQSWHNHEHKGPQANVDGEKIPSKPG